MRELFRLMEKALSNGDDAVLVTVIASSGSTPRGAGARMLITKDGRLRGTIGGGAVEYKSEQLAQEVLKNRLSVTEHFRLHPNEVADLGMICGGAVDVYFRFIPAGDEKLLALTRKIEELFSAHEQSWLICDVTPGKDGAIGVCGAKSGVFGIDVPDEALNALACKPAQVRCGETLYYCEELLKSGRVYIFGGGHVAQALVPELARVGFRCVVVEDRPDFARAGLFEGVEETILTETAGFLELAQKIGPEDYVCVMTRGHKDDYEVQKYMLRSGARYIGVIGSAKKSSAVFEKLRADGYTEKELSRITTPIGLDIAAETPAEIAVSIAAQLIMVRAGKSIISWEKLKNVGAV